MCVPCQSALSGGPALESPLLELGPLLIESQIEGRAPQIRFFARKGKQFLEGKKKNPHAKGIARFWRHPADRSCQGHGNYGPITRPRYLAIVVEMTGFLIGQVRARSWGSRSQPPNWPACMNMKHCPLLLAHWAPRPCPARASERC